MPVLAAGIRDAVTRLSYRARAQALAAQLAEEDAGPPVLVAFAAR